MTMTTITNTINYSPSHNVKNAGTIKYNENPLKGLLKNDREGQVKRAALAGSGALRELGQGLRRSLSRRGDL